MVNQKRHGLRLDADFTEDMVGFALSMFLALMSFPRHRFSIEPFSRARERRLGADARLMGRIRGFQPFYMQFKKPSAFLNNSTSGIIKDRNKLKLEVNPHAMYFDLRQKQNYHSDFQHNILFKLNTYLRQRQLGYAAYVCPLFLNRINYSDAVHWSALAIRRRVWSGDPWNFENVTITDNGIPNLTFQVPVLAQHVSITPHNIVSSANHRYSFTESGSQVCFHSPENIVEGVLNLADLLKLLFNEFRYEGKKIQRSDARNELQIIKSKIFPDSPELRDAVIDLDLDDLIDYPISDWLHWGDYLRREFNIEQYAFVQWDD